MTAPARHPILSQERALHVAAFAALIDQTLGDRGEALVPRFAAQDLLAQFSHTGLAEVQSDPDSLRMTLFGIPARCTTSPYGLLRAWQAAARDRLAQGVQR